MTGSTGVRYREETVAAFRDAEHDLLAAHSDLMASRATEVEGLDRAACATHIGDLARLAMGASAEGVTAEEWRGWLLGALGVRGEPVLRAAEHCMRANGLWPWPR